VADAEYARVAAAALAAAPTLLARWLGGGPKGDEWFGARTADGGPGDSWVVNLKTGVWSHFASGERGHDLIGVYAGRFRVKQGMAKDAVAAELALTEPVLLPRERALIPDIPQRIPEDAPTIRANSRLGEPTHVHRGYLPWALIQRFDRPDGSKQFVQWTWRNDRWTPQGYGPGHPLYNLHNLRSQPETPVLLVEGERCVEASQPLLEGLYVVTTWAGGAAGAKRADWEPLYHRDVLIWPDADDPGRKAAAEIGARLHGKARSVRHINPNGAAVGWDIGDAVKDQWDTPRLIGWMRDHTVPQIEAPKPAKIHQNQPPAPAPGEPPSAALSYADMGLDCDGKGVPYPTMANASKVLQLYRNFKGNIWLDEFRGTVYHTVNCSEPRPWRDSDTREVTYAIQDSLKLHKFHQNLVGEAIQHAAERNRRNSLLDWLNSLQWDGTPRLETWLYDCGGVELSDYTRAVARNWLMGMVARAFRPGCKMDHMPVLEGTTDLGKSLFLSTLGGEWFKVVGTKMDTKDFLQVLRGAWLIEIPDMSGFQGADHGRVIGMITTPIDSYRASYGRLSEDVPRTCVFAGTSENSEYLADRRGIRRWWPLEFTAIHIEVLKLQRPQLFAEAVHRFKEGESWHVMPAGTREQQIKRSTDDPWTEKILEVALKWWREELLNEHVTKTVRANRLIAEALLKPISQITTGDCRRVSAILGSAGWRTRRDKDGSWWIWPHPLG
jgi:hypothetical protein